MSTPVINPYEISMEELARLAANQPLPEPTGEPAPGQPRDERGRFVATEPEVGEPQADEAVEPQADSAAPEAEPEEFYHRETVDIGEGGAQVFTGIGASPEEAVQDCLRQVVEAQKHATRKIRELSRGTQPAAQPQAPVHNYANEAELAQAILSEPSRAIQQVLEQQLGMTVAQAKAKLEQAERVEMAQQADAAAREFVAATPDFYAHPTNADRIEKFIKLNGLPFTVEGINQAYTALSADGLLLTKPADTPAPAVRHRSSGLSTRRAAPAPAKTQADIERELRSMPLDKLRDAIGYQNRY